MSFFHSTNVVGRWWWRMARIMIIMMVYGGTIVTGLQVGTTTRRSRASRIVSHYHHHHHHHYHPTVTVGSLSPTMLQQLRPQSQLQVQSTRLAAAAATTTTTRKRWESVCSQLTMAFPLWVASAALLGGCAPQTLSWVVTFHPSLVPTLLATVMVGTGTTLQEDDFARWLPWSNGNGNGNGNGKATTTPPADKRSSVPLGWLVPLGVACQYTVMPLASWLVGRLFFASSSNNNNNNNRNLRLGLVLVGSCPGGTASNLVSLLAGADVALSVLLTAVSTLLAAVVTPLWVRLLCGTGTGHHVPIQGRSLAIATAKVVLVPVLVGMNLRQRFPRWTETSFLCQHVVPLASVVLVALLCGGVVASSAATLAGVRLVTAVTMLHAIGFALGYFAVPSSFFVQKDKDNENENDNDNNASSTTTTTTTTLRQARRTLSIETGMQNSALAVVLAGTLVAQGHSGIDASCALPGAISATCHSVLGSLLAAYWRYQDRQSKE